MAQLPDVVGTALSESRKLAAPDASPKIDTGAVPDGMALSTIDARQDPTMIDNSGSAVTNAADQANQIVTQQVDAAQKTWLLNASAQHELDAQSMLANAQRNAQPGQEITPILQDALTQQSQQKVAQIDSPMLAQNYQNEMTHANASILAQAQQFDFQQRDAQVENNFKQGIDAQQKTLSLLQSPQDVESKFGEMMAGVNGNIASLPLTPQVKMQLQDYARAKLTDAANMTAIQLDPKGFLARNTGSPQDAAMQFILSKEGSALTTDNNGTATKYGINQANNPDVDVKNLTQDQAKQIIQSRYIDKVVTPDMSPQMAMVAADSAVNMGVGKTQQLLAQAGGDPQKMIDLRRAEYERLAQANPDKYGGALNGWENRLNDLQNRLPDVTPRTMPGDDLGTTKQDIGGWMPMQLSTYAQRNQNIETAQSLSDQQDKATQQAQTVQKAAFNSDFDIALGRGQKTYQDIDNAYQAGMITPAQRTQYTQKLDEVNGNAIKGMAAMGRVNDALGGQAVLDPKNPDDRAAVDRHFQGWLQSQPQPQNAQDSQVLQNKEVALAGQYGMVPKTMLDGLRASLRSSKPEDIANASGMISQLRQTNPVLLNDVDEKDLKASNHISSLVSDGYSPNAAVGQAASELKQPPDVTKTRQQEANTLTTKTNLAANSIGSNYSSVKNFPVLGSLATSLLPIQSPNPEQTSFLSPKIPPSAVNDWNTIFKTEYARTGNADASTQSANDIFTRNWGKTNVGSSLEDGTTNDRLMKFPPEKYYSASVPGLNQGKWMNEQLSDAAQAAQPSLKGVDPSTLMLTPSNKVLPDGRPTYYVFHKDDNGILNQVPMEWHPDFNSSKEYGRVQARARYQAQTGDDGGVVSRLGDALSDMAN